jgi:nitrogen fixation protein FixH
MKPHHAPLKLPPHLAWPAGIIGLLLLGATSTFGVLIAARSDGGPAVVEDYYQQALRWDTLARQQAASDALGWQVQVQVLPSSTLEHTVLLTLTDRHRQPLTGLAGTIRAFRPEQTAVQGTAALQADASTPGLYRQPLPLHKAGLWDLEIVAQRGADRFQKKVRVER